MYIETTVHNIIFRGFDKFLSANERNVYASDYTGIAGYINYTQLHSLGMSQLSGGTNLSFDYFTAASF